MHRFVCLIFAALFLTAAAVQWNDPDPTRWIVLYVVTGALSVWAAFGTVNPLVALVVGLGALVWARFIVLPWNEEEREVVGLVVVGLWLVLGLAWRAVPSDGASGTRDGEAGGRA